MDKRERIPIVSGTTQDDIDTPIYLNEDYVVLDIRENKHIEEAARSLVRTSKLEVGDIIRFECNRNTFWNLSKGFESPFTKLKVLQVGHLGQEQESEDMPKVAMDDLDLLGVALLFTRYMSNNLGLYCLGNEEDYKAVLQGVPVEDVAI